jgi:PKHD-type hydroxylase
MLRQYFQVFEKALPSDFCDYLVKATKWEEEAKIRRDGNIVEPVSRISQISWLNTMSPIGCIAQSYFLEANKIWNYNLSSIEKVQMTKYSVGGHYDWHMDSFEPNENNEQRKLSISILLNDDFEGGGLEIQGKTIENVLKSKGDIVVFPSFLTHKVVPITKGTRYSAVSWAYGATFR